MGANLVPIVDVDSQSLHIETNKTFSADDGDVKDGCVEVGHTYKLLRFTFRARNIGDAPFLIGVASKSNPLFEWSESHQHLHMREFNQYKLFDVQGNLAVPSKKPGFCVEDVHKWDPSAGPKKFDGCAEGSLMGVSPGWEDVYGEFLGCQYLILRDEAGGTVHRNVADGDYTLVATTNTRHAVPEDNFDDNTVCIGLRLTGDQVQALPSPPLHVELVTPTVNFNDVPEGETAARPVEFEVRSCGSASFSITSGPTKLTGPAATTFGTIATPGSSLAHDDTVLPRNAFLWLTYKGTTTGDVATGEVKVKCNETGHQWTVPITANTIARPTVAVVLTLDQSGSMARDAGTGAKRIDVLHDAASRFVELAQANNGVGLVRFDHAAYPIDPVLRLTDPSVDPNRAKLIADVKATSPNGATSIGNGIQSARSTLDPVGGYDKKAIVVFTDGLENTSKYIRDVKDLITDRTFAIGLGTAQQVSAGALTQLTHDTGGYLLVSGALTSAIDDYFRLSKYFLQILAAVTNNSVVKDPSGYVGPGQRLRLPFTLNSSDIDATAILMTDYPVVEFGLETPDGHLVGPAEATALGATVAAGSNMLYYRFGLPLLAGARAAHAGTWHAILAVRDWSEAMTARFVGPAGRMARYSVSVHAYSNVRMSASLTQDSFEPGATLGLRVALTEFGIPLANGASVHAELRSPSATQAAIVLVAVEPGVFAIALRADEIGVYQLRVVAAGRTHRGEMFTREQLLTGVTVVGGNAPPPTTKPSDPRDEALCRLLECLMSSEALAGFWERQGINRASLERCVRAFCEAQVSPPSDREFVEREGGAPTATGNGGTVEQFLAAPGVMDALRRLVAREGT